jgi:hypothetical protein
LLRAAIPNLLWAFLPTLKVSGKPGQHHGSRLAAQLLRAAFNRAKRLRRAELWLASRSTPVEPASMALPPLAGHPDLVLARAVAHGIITPDEAELIGRTRLERVSVAAVAAANRYQPGTLARRRERAQARLVRWLLRGSQPASRRPWRTVPIRLHPSPAPGVGPQHQPPVAMRHANQPASPDDRGTRPADPLWAPRPQP